MKPTTLSKLLFIILLVGCTESTKEVDSLPSEQLAFSELPVVVQDYFRNPDSFANNEVHGFVFLNLVDTSRFEISVVQSSLMPWVYYPHITDKSYSMTYTMEEGYPDPYILLGDTLIVPEQYSTLAKTDYLEELKFRKYILTR